MLYQPGLHHLAFNADSHARVDALAGLVRRLGGTNLEGAGEHPSGVDGYTAEHVLGPDGLKSELVPMPALAILLGS